MLWTNFTQIFIYLLAVSSGYLYLYQYVFIPLSDELS